MRRLFIILFLLCAFPAWGTTLYVGPGETYTTIAAGCAAMQGGDTLIIRNGVYTGASNIFTNAQRPPSGSDGAYSRIQAESIGGVTIDGEDTRTPLYITDTEMSYIIFEGIHFTKGGATEGGNVRLIDCDHIKMLNCSSSYAANGGHGFSSVRGSYILYEDCWVWGHAQYAFHFRESDHCIARRCVARIDYALSNDLYIAGFMSYWSNYIEFQNCMMIDQDQETYLDDNSNGYGGIFGFLLRNGTGGNIAYRGCVVLNVYTGTAPVFLGDGPTPVSVDDTVVWDVSGSADTFYARAVSDFPCNHLVVGNNANISGERGVYNSGATLGSLANSIVMNIDGVAVQNLASADHICFYDNSTDTLVTTATNPITGINPLTASLLYLPRIESGSTLSTAGADGTYVGARIMKMMGSSGTLYDETGYATLTDDNLWPWPNEAKIKADFATDSHETIVEARGFAAAGKQLDGVTDITLTSYVWEYLGNEIPSDIYGTPTVTHSAGGTAGWR